MTAVDADPHAMFAEAKVWIITGYEDGREALADPRLAKSLMRQSMLFDSGGADPGLLPTAVDEILRSESPVKMSTIRVTTEPLTVGETTVPAGRPALVSLIGANRDPQAFGAPDDLLLSRKDSQHLTFGHGPHFCLGAPLARMEGEIAIGSLLDRFPRLSLAEPAAEPSWRPGVLLRGLTRLPIRLA